MNAKKHKQSIGFPIDRAQRQANNADIATHTGAADMGHIGWAEHSLAAYLAGEERDEAEAEAYNQRVEDLMRDAMDEIACSDLEKLDREPVDDIQEHFIPSAADTSESPAQILRKALRSAAVTFAKGDRGPGAYHDAGSLLMSALVAACYLKAEEEAKK